MRIIGGKWKRTPLAVIETSGLRPTPDRVRETVFNWLEHLLPDITRADGLDLFAGTGALGFEFASRGARAVTLVDASPAAVRQLARVRDKLEATQVNIVSGDALAKVSKWPGASFDVIFVDPPFGSGLHQPALRNATRLARPGGFIYLEGPHPIDVASLPPGLSQSRSGRAGRVYFSLLHRA